MHGKSQYSEISREEAAAEVLSLWEKNQYSLRTAMGQLAEEWNITDWHIRTAIHSLVFETVRRLNTIDYVLNTILKKTLITDLDSLTRNTLRIAGYLIIFGEGVPALVTNEAVSIIKRRRNKRLAGLCNAVLRKVQQTDLEKFVQTTSREEEKILQYSVPQWLLEYTEQLLGPEDAGEFLSAGLESPSTYIRINTLHDQADTVIKRLEKEEFQCTPVPQLPEIYKIQQGTQPVIQTDLYTQNTIYLQSLASALVARILNPKREGIVVDLCAAPGSKTSHLAQLMENQGNIIAIDNILVRIQELKRNLIRLGVHNTHILFANSFKLPFRQDFQADSVLVDPPCSNTGVIQTRPEVKWMMTPEKVQRLTKVQKSLMRAGSKIVAPDGYIVYSTCSITLDENEYLIRGFLAANRNFELVTTQPILGFPAFEGMASCQRLFPHKQDTEGFFIAKLHRKLESND
jgi:16S rRNA (cytosine967-C5)-methyltransferase